MTEEVKDSRARDGHIGMVTNFRHPGRYRSDSVAGRGLPEPPHKGRPLSQVPRDYYCWLIDRGGLNEGRSILYAYPEH